MNVHRSSTFFCSRLSFHIVGKGVCLVMLWQNPARRDKPWNYIPLEFQRYTKLILATWYLYGHVENVWGIPFPKRIKGKDCFLSELFQKQVSDYNLTTCWCLIDRTTKGLQISWMDTNKVDRLVDTTDDQGWLQVGRLQQTHIWLKMTESTNGYQV